MILSPYESDHSRQQSDAESCDCFEQADMILAEFERAGFEVVSK